MELINNQINSCISNKNDRELLTSFINNTILDIKTLKLILI